jgi:hypothetical protein
MIHRVRVQNIKRIGNVSVDLSERTHMASFSSNAEYFQALAALLAKLESAGHLQAVTALKDGLGYLNGLTDGYAHFLESIEKVQAKESSQFASEDQEALEQIREAVHRAVYRR